MNATAATRTRNMPDRAEFTKRDAGLVASRYFDQQTNLCKWISLSYPFLKTESPKALSTWADESRVISCNFSDFVSILLFFLIF
jgi:hypothetical protein